MSNETAKNTSFNDIYSAESMLGRIWEEKYLLSTHSVGLFLNLLIVWITLRYIQKSSIYATLLMNQAIVNVLLCVTVLVSMVIIHVIISMKVYFRDIYFAPNRPLWSTVLGWITMLSGELTYVEQMAMLLVVLNRFANLYWSHEFYQRFMTGKWTIVFYCVMCYSVLIPIHFTLFDWCQMWIGIAAIILTFLLSSAVYWKIRSVNKSGNGIDIHDSSSPLSYLSTRAALIFVIEPLIEWVPMILRMFIFFFDPPTVAKLKQLSPIQLHLLALPYYNYQLTTVYCALAVLLFVRPYRIAFKALISTAGNKLKHVNGEKEKNYTENLSSINVDTDSILPYKKM